MQTFDMHLPESFDDACALLAENNAKPISGGSALITLIKEGIYQPDILVNLRRLQAEHGYIEERNGSLHIGALATFREIETSDVVIDRLPLIADCLSKIASIRVRNVATVGGHLAHSDPDLDFPPVLAGLGARVVIHGLDGERTVDLRDFIKGFYQTDLGAGELIKAIQVPIDPSRHGVYLKHRSLSEADWPCVGVAAFLDDDPEAVPEVYMNSVADTPIFRLDGIEAVVDGSLDDATVERIGDLAKEQCDPVGDARGSVWYKREMAREFTIRAVRRVAGMTPEIPPVVGGA